MAATSSASSFPRPAPSEGYTKVLNAIIRAKLKAGPKSLYVILASYNFGDQAEAVTISQARLAQECAATIRTIRRWTRILEDAGWLRVFETQGCRHRYELLVPHHPGQIVREVASSPRTESPESSAEPRIDTPGNPGHEQRPGKDSSNNSPSTINQKDTKPGIKDPWAHLRGDPTVQKAFRAGVSRRR